MTRGFSFAELIVLVVIAVMALVPSITLSSRAFGDPHELIEWSTAQELCLDMIDRFKQYDCDRPLPGTPLESSDSLPPPPLAEAFGPLEVDLNRTTLFDRVYLEQMRNRGFHPMPTIERTPIPGEPGLFLLTITVKWESSSGRSQQVRHRRICYVR